MDISPLQQSFGLRCKELRLESGYSQEQFANRIDMDRSYYASIEVGRRNVSLSNLSKLPMDSTYQLLHLWLVSLIKRISPSSANAVSVSIDGVAGGKDTVRGRAASFASEGDGIAVPISF